MAHSHFRLRALHGQLARIERNDYSPQFPLRLMNRDFQLNLKTAARENVPMPTEAAFRVNADELATGEEQDFSAILRRMEEVAGVAVTHSIR
jgi:3-hydroxyisobutyrate dehydrogenase-like beta-hydroxyacid dehydrogenase